MTWKRGAVQSFRYFFCFFLCGVWGTESMPEVGVLVDALGHANVGFHRHEAQPPPEVHTPNMDALAGAGIVPATRPGREKVPGAVISQSVWPLKQQHMSLFQ